MSLQSGSGLLAREYILQISDTSLITLVIEVQIPHILVTETRSSVFLFNKPNNSRQALLSFYGWSSSLGCLIIGDTLGNLVTFFYKATWNQEQFLLPLQLPLRRKKDYTCALRASKNFYSSNQFASQSEFLFQHPVRCFQGKGAVIGLNKPFRPHNAILPPFTHTGEVILNTADTGEPFKSQQANVIQTFFQW